MNLKKICVGRFLELAESIPVIDVRSPSEFNKGHIPGAINIPLFSDTERMSVGIKYKNEGRVPSILEGLKYTAPEMTSKLEQALGIAKNGKLLVHCWRGGMRSEAMAWLFSLGDIKTEVLEGGYKSYHNHILKSLSEKRKMIVLGGMTGSSKTHILRYLKQTGQQIIDLEGLANHKGSAFGSLGQPPQPSTEHFTNILFNEWKQINKNLPFWLEDESRNIGSVFMPDRFYLNMQEAPAVIIIMDVKTRLPRLMEEYSNYSVESLKASIIRISKRLGGDNTRDALNAVETGDFGKAIEITLYYYDKAYLFGLTKKNNKNIIYIKTDSNDIEANSLKILNAAGKIKW
ncbi:MAG TPA: tRNA 2-selenouridine(34) synthase MnmH [Anaerovoracaceae bacterium]|nr:tRNA 2-selenouridine(34) synthase MnmH [Anaerovoracaceae bacterium]